MSTPLNKASRTFLAVASVSGEEDFPIGFVASLAQPSGTMTGVWRAHKTVVTLPETDPREKEIWRLVSDAQAASHIAEGLRFMSMAPIRYALYRDDPLSGWKPTSKNERRKLAGYCSHEYLLSSHATLIPDLADLGITEDQGKMPGPGKDFGTARIAPRQGSCSDNGG
jgi:hypothetical protein